MKAKQSLLQFVLLVSILFFCQTSDAQIIFDQTIDDETPPIPEAPINGLIGLGLLIGTYFGYKKLKK